MTRLHLLHLEDRSTPSGMPASWSTRGAGGGGALFSPWINPANPSEYTIASDMSQVFRTLDSGATWSTISFRELQAGHESRVQTTDNPNIRYSLDYSFDAITPTKSTDGGTTWTPFANDPTGGGAVYLFADPANANRVLVSDYFNLYYTGNGGATWQLKFTTADGAGLLLGGAFWDGATIVVGTNQGLLRSTDNGGTFAVQSTSGLNGAIVSFAGGKTGSTTKFTAVTWPAGDVYAGVAGYENPGTGQVFTLTSGTWTWAPQTIPAGTTPFLAAMARNDANTMYVAGGSDAGSPTVVKSTGGAWANVLNTINNANVKTGWSGHGGDRGWSYGELAMGFTVDNLNSNRLIITDYGFAHSSTDGGANWNALYVNPADRNPAGASTPTGKAYRDSGLDNTTAWQVTWTAQPGTMILANSDIRGQRSTDGGVNFGFGYSGHTNNSLYRVAKDTNGVLYGATGTRHDLYQSTTLADSSIDPAGGTVLRSTDHGATWTTIRDFGDVVSWVAVDPNNNNRVYASVVNSTAGGIYVTQNANLGTAATWAKLSNPPRTQGHPFNIVVLNDGNLVVSYSGRRTSAGAFTASSGVFYYNTAQGVWYDRSAAGLQYWTKDVVIDPFDSTQNTWYAGVFSGWGGPPNGLGGLYKSTDRGQNWTRILNLDRVTSCTFNPSDANELFVTTEQEGLWRSANIRTATPTFTQSTSYPFRQPERVFFNPQNNDELWVTSFGGGVMVGVNNPLPPTTVSNITVNNNSVQRSRLTELTLTFNNPVDVVALNTIGAITLTRTSGGPATVVQTGATGANGKIIIAPISGLVTTLTLSFGNADNSAVTAGVEYGSLSDGRWQLAIPSMNYTSPLNGTTLRRLFGDLNGDGSTSGDDFLTFGNLFNSNATSVDYNADGTVSGADLLQFGNRFGINV